MDLNKIINDTLKEFENEKFLEKTVRKHLEKSVNDVVQGTLQSYSEFGTGCILLELIVKTNNESEMT